MKCSLYFFILCVWIFKMEGVLCVDSHFSSEIDRYLEEKSQFLRFTLSQSKHFLSKRHYLESNDITIERETSTTLEERNVDVNFFTFFNTTYLRMGKSIFKMIYSNKTVALTKIGNKFRKFPDGKKALFTKAIEFDGRGMILTRFEVGEAHMYGLVEDDPFFIQTLLVPHSRDAGFFVHNGDLYLIVVNNKGDNLAATSLYKWLGSHFDEIQTVFTTGAIKVTTFSSQTSEIIIILRQLPNRAVFSEVYEFQEEEMKKIQILETEHPVNLDTYSSKNKTHVIIYERSKNNAIYQWNGFRLTNVNTIETQTEVILSGISTINNKSLLMISSNDTLSVYSLSANKLTMGSEKWNSSELTRILDLHNHVDGSEVLSFIAGSNQDDNVTISVVHTTANFSETETSGNEGEQLRECFNNLERNVYARRKTLKDARSKLKNFEELDSAKLENNSSVVLGESSTLDSEAEVKISELSTRLDLVNSLLDSYSMPNGSNIVVNGSLILKGKIRCSKMDARNVVIKSLNSHEFTPEQWLKYDEPQTITGPVKLKHVVTNHLDVSPEYSLVKDMVLQSEGKLVFTEKTRIGVLTAEKMYSEKINGILVNDIYLRSSGEPIKGVKTFENLKADEVKVKLLNGEQPDEILSILSKNKLTDLNFDSNVTINNLQVKTINDINWNEFKDSVFRIGTDSTLTGPLHFSKIKTEHLNVEKLNEEAVEDFLTKSTDQTIHSDIIFNRIFAGNISAQSVNGIKLSESAVWFGKNDSIGPITIDKLNVENDLEISGKVDDFLILKDGNRILGTNESDLLQQYEGTVRIKGNLYLRNLTLQPNAKLYLSGNEVEPDIQNIYWSKSTNQEIPTHVTVQGLNVPHVLTNVLNGVKFSQYMINSDTDTLETDYHFDKVIVNGNVLLHNNAVHQPDLDKLVKEAVKTKGSFMINGQKTYVDTLRAENLVTSKLEGINTLDVLNTRWPSNVTGTKTFKNVIVEGNVNSKIDHVDILNNVNVDDFKNEIIYIDQEQHLNKMDFEHLNVTNLHVQKLNGHQIEDYLDTMNKLQSLNKLESLVVNGNITIQNIFNVSRINDIPVEDILNKAPTIGEHGVIESDVRFSGKVKVGNLVTLFVNNQNMRSLTRRLLLRNLNQTITAPYSFENIKAGNLITPRINDKTVTNLIDVSTKRPQEITVPGGVAFRSEISMRTLIADKMTPCHIKSIAEELHDPSPKEWSSVKIRGNVTLLDDQNVLFRIFEKAVRMSTNNIIDAQVKFIGDVSAKQINADKHVNDINLLDIIEDAVFTESENEQIITGRKWFASLEAKEAVVMKNADIQVINGEDIQSLNDDIVDKNSIGETVIRGEKIFFGGLQTNRLNTKTIDLENIVNLDNPKKVPSAIFDYLDVSNDLNISFVNNIDFRNTLSNRLLCKSDHDQSANGIYYFEDVYVKDLTTPSINDIKIDDVVFDEGIQNITGPKRFSEKVHVFGDISVELINGISIREEYNKSILLGKPANINGSIVVMRPSRINGNIETESINGIRVSSIKEILEKTDTEAESQEIYYYKDRIIDNIRRNIPISQGLPQEYMYLEKSDDLQISVPDTLSASVVTSKGYVLLHVTGKEPSGEYCGLPRYCECPLQYALEISPERSITAFPDKGSQRIFSYDDEKMIVHFITNSVSTSANCSTDKSKLMNEVSMMTWNTLSTVNVTGQFYQYPKFFPGYISKVVYFTLDDITYALVGRYYDPVLGSNDLDCTVIRFDEKRMNATETQKILTRGVNELHVFHTAQGVVLVIGNSIGPQNEDADGETQIHRFNQLTGQFELLRIIPSFACSKATGVVLGTDSFIAMAHKIAPVQVLRYIPEYDNYFFYQSFELEEPVIGVSSFYTGGYGVSDAYLAIITGTDKYFIYSFEFLEGWKLISSGELEGVRNFIPFEMEKQSYLFAPSSKTSSLLTVVKSGFN
ncbi:unnamed protein product [Phaedon cochleariae]|uniref:Uncharacterized protein n=1 Tax=Phaedon cochleariae TaxID=80249 RepID=A0A9N9X1L8_PHACE|nr:unnamed protein product [Phaedon cochleariae]